MSDAYSTVQFPSKFRAELVWNLSIGYKYTDKILFPLLITYQPLKKPIIIKKMEMVFLYHMQRTVTVSYIVLHLEVGKSSSNFPKQHLALSTRRLL